jgi:uncharacterized MnhB-related membrane protein
VTDALLAVLLTVVGIVGTLVVVTREPVRQVIVVGIYGLALALLFFAVQAPDVGLSQLVVGSVALPAMLLLAIAKVREQEAAFEEDEEGDE